MEVVQYSGGNISTVGIASVQYIDGYLQYMRGGSISTVGDSIRNVESIQYSGGRFLVSACFTIKNDKKISIIFCIMKRNFHSEVSKILADLMPFKR